MKKIIARGKVDNIIYVVVIILCINLGSYFIYKRITSDKLWVVKLEKKGSEQLETFIIKDFYVSTNSYLNHLPPAFISNLAESLARINSKKSSKEIYEDMIKDNTNKSKFSISFLKVEPDKNDPQLSASYTANGKKYCNQLVEMWNTINFDKISYLNIIPKKEMDDLYNKILTISKLKQSKYIRNR